MAGSRIVDGRFNDKVAVVTGGASGIGEAIARRLIAEGAKVVVGDVNRDRIALLEKEFGDTQLVGSPGDVREEADVEAMVGVGTEHFGGVDLGFNVAGLGRSSPIIDHSLEDWKFVVDVCLTGVFLSMKHEARAMQERGGGSIVNISSLNSRVPMFGGSAYCAAKAGCAMLAQAGALEFAELNIRVNAISPGLTDTPLTAMLSQVPGAREAYMERIPLKRAATPEDIAAAALFLASDDGGYVSGINMFVDGAWEQTAYPDLRPYLAAAMAGRE
jgi:NAD(P)-dependent dehydrogenase (short-subunit alcohol dehydrogenase family)